MFRILMVGLALFVPSEPPLKGLATYYNPGLMPLVYANRVRAGEITPCPECVGVVALLRREHLNRRVWLIVEGYEPVGPLLVIDCAPVSLYRYLLGRGWVADLDWPLAQTLHMRGPISLEVWFSDPRSPP